MTLSQAFDKVWHTGLLLKLKQALTHLEYTLLRSYLTHRKLKVRNRKEYTQLYPVHAGVPQGSILGPILYTIFTADLPVKEQTTIATYADATVIVASHESSSHNYETSNSSAPIRTLVTSMADERQRVQIYTSHLYTQTRRLSSGLPKRTTHSPTGLSQISRTTSGPPTQLEHAYSSQKETTRSFV